ncbi:MAG: hypothetical protein AMJ81_12340 [Phycisphaerae bacterium SM23_33]|nr:MAG: hypothetical protein AMJ81_12340 [Phycisphaerae bacterium SM23_33]
MCAAAGLAFAAPVWAGPTTTGSADDARLQQEIARAVRDLGSDSWRVREEATRRLWSIGRPAEAALRRAAESADPEVRFRANTILEKFRYGIYPDTPKEVLKLIEDYRGAAPSARVNFARLLIDKGIHGCRALLCLAKAEEDEKLRRRLFEQVHRNVGRVVPVLLAEEDFAEAEMLLEAAASSGAEFAMRNYAAYHLIRGRLDQAVARCQAEARSDPAAARQLTFLYRARGELEKARAAAKASGDQGLLKSVLYELGDWKALAEMHARELAGGKQDIESLGFLAAYHRLAGNARPFEDAIARIKALNGSEPGHHWHQAEALLVNERFDEALDFLLAKKMYSPAFRLLCAQLRFDRALGLVNQARAEKHAESFSLAAGAARRWAALGENDKARRMLEELAGQARLDAKPSLSYELIQAEVALDMKQEALRHCAEALASLKGDDSPSSLLSAVFPGVRFSMESWWKLLRGAFPDEDCAETLSRLKDLVEKKTPEKELARLAEFVAGQDKTPASGRRHWLDLIAGACQESGYDELALELRWRCVELEASEFTIERLADALAKVKRWAEAAEQYRIAWKSGQNRPFHAYLAGAALTRAGRKAEGKQLMELAVLLPLADQTSRYNLAFEAARRGHQAEADRQYDLIVRTGEPASYEIGECLRSELYRLALGRQDYFRAAACAERGRLPCLSLSTGMSDPAGYLVVSARIHGALARGHLRAGRVAEGLQEAQLCHAALPGDTDVAITLVSDLDRLKRGKEADALFSRYFDRLEKVCREYPNAAGYRNRAAWLAARCRRRLDRAAKLAERAVELAGDNPAYLDTLAEIHFQRRDRGGALRLIKRCIELDAERPYYRGQLKRFQAGDPATDPPAEQ